MAIKTPFYALAVVQGLPHHAGFHIAIGQGFHQHIVNHVAGAWHRRGRSGFACTDAEHAVFQTRAVFVIHIRQALIRVLHISVFIYPLRDVEQAVFIVQIQIRFPLAGIAQGRFVK